MNGARHLHDQLAAGDELSITRTLNRAIGSCEPEQESQTRRTVLLAATATMSRLIHARSKTALKTGRIRTAVTLNGLSKELAAFADDMAGAPLDADADILRIQALQLHVDSAGNAPDLLPTLRAMTRVAFAGTHPVH